MLDSLACKEILIPFCNFKFGEFLGGGGDYYGDTCVLAGHLGNLAESHITIQKLESSGIAPIIGLPTLFSAVREFQLSLSSTPFLPEPP